MMRRLQAYWRHDVHVLPRCRYRRYDGRDCVEYCGTYGTYGTVSYGTVLRSLRCGLLTREPNAVPAPERPYF